MSCKNLRIVLLGLPGAGKSTQAATISHQLKLPWITLRDAFEREFAERTPLGGQLRPYTEQWARVPDDLIIPLILRRLALPDANGSWIADGFPKTRRQADALEPWQPTAILLDIPGDVSRTRCSRRLVCDRCGTIDPQARASMQHGKCGGTFIRRFDDEPDAHDRRYSWRHPELQQLRAFYAAAGRLWTIAADAAPDQVGRAVLAALAPA